jgi:prepilin-type N-terminal cleavage/methylation domain-containing protein
MKRQRKGFTLVELAIVIAILGILAVVAIPKYQGMVDEARSAAARAQLGTVRSAIAITYAKQRGTFPVIASAALVDKNGASIFADGVMPTVDIGTSNSGTVVAGSAATTDAGGWMYNGTNGRLIINSTAADVSATPSTTLWSSY